MKNRCWASWKVSYLPLKVMTSFSGSRKVASSTSSPILPQPGAGSTGAPERADHPAIITSSHHQSMVRKPRFPVESLLCIKSKERIVNQMGKTKRKRWSRHHKTS